MYTKKLKTQNNLLEKSKTLTIFPIAHIVKVNNAKKTIYKMHKFLMNPDISHHLMQLTQGWKSCLAITAFG